MSHVPRRRREPGDRATLPRSRLPPRILLGEVAAGVAARPARLALTTLGTVLGVASLLATLGLASTAAGQIGAHFDAVAATQVSVVPRTSTGQDGQALARLPWDAPERVGRLAGVVAAGTASTLDVGPDRARAVAVLDPQAPGDHALPVVAGSAGLLDAVRGHVVTGRFFDQGHDQRADPVAVLGANAAERLHLTRVDTQPSIFLGDRPYTVIGIIDGVARRTDLLDAVILPNGTAAEHYALAAPQQLHIRTDLGAAPLIGRQAPIAVDPNHPELYDATVPSAVGGVRDRIEAEVDALFLLLGGVALLVGGLGIANVTLLGVLERVGEIGLRRALGATRRHVAAQFLLESVVIGLLGGLVGAALGVLTVVGVSAVHRWTPLLDPTLVAAAPLLGAAIGLVAGGYPAWRAAAIEPIAALRADA